MGTKIHGSLGAFVLLLAQTASAQDCNFLSIAGEEFTFSEQSENLRHYGYQLWSKNTSIPPSKLTYDEYAGVKGKFLGTTTRSSQIASATFLDAISEKCEKLYYFDAGRKGIEQLKQMPMIAGIRFAADDKAIQSLIGKNFWVDTHSEYKAVLRDQQDHPLPLGYGEKCRADSVDTSHGFENLMVTCGSKHGALRYDHTYILSKNPMNPAWGAKTVALIQSGSVSIGMNAEQVRAAWGKPKSVNKTVTNGGSTEQWVYGDQQYVYLKNGAVTSIQATETP